MEIPKRDETNSFTHKRSHNTHTKCCQFKSRRNFLVILFNFIDQNEEENYVYKKT